MKCVAQALGRSVPSLGTIHHKLWDKDHKLWDDFFYSVYSFPLCRCSSKYLRTLLRLCLSSSRTLRKLLPLCRCSSKYLRNLLRLCLSSSRTLRELLPLCRCSSPTLRNLLPVSRSHFLILFLIIIDDRRWSQ